ncbi:hypothetical protein ACFL0M_09195 [Thermodesulfobacteriota bacterium]
MKFKSIFTCLFFVLLSGSFLLISRADAAKPIAKVSAFKGEVIILSDAKVNKVQNVGHVLNQGDRIQTADATVQITFEDGAIIKVRPYTNLMIQERQEKSGWFIFKTKKAVRRISVFVGKLWFKSGTSKRRNYLQTITAVCGVRGSAHDWGTDGLRNFLNTYEGGVDILGNVVQGFFDDTGIGEAEKNRVYNTISRAIRSAERARSPREIAETRSLVFQSVAVASNLLQSNPESIVAKEARVAENVANAHFAAAQAEVVVEQLAEAGAPEAEITAALSAAASVQTQAQLADTAAAGLYDAEGTLVTENFEAVITETEQIKNEAYKILSDAGITITTVPLPATTLPPPTTRPPTTTPTDEEEETTTTTTVYGG